MTQAAAVIPHSPTVFTRDGHVFTNSVEVAKYFAKRHPYVTQSIERLIADGVSYFTETSYFNGKTGKLFKSYDMNRSGFVLLAMGFTGSRALRWKIAYLEAFDAMEAMLRAPQAQPAAVLNMRAPGQIALAFTQAVEMLQELQVENKAIKEEMAVVSSELAVAAPAIDFFARYGDADGYILPSVAAKVLGVRHGKFFERMRKDHILLDRAKTLVPAQRFLDKGYFVVKTDVTRDTGYAFTQTMVTPRGMQFLATLFGRNPDLFTRRQLAIAA